MTLDQLQRHAAFTQLTDKQKKFTLAYCNNGGDKIAASKEAFDCKTDASFSAIANNTLKQKNVKLIVALFFGFDAEVRPMSKEEFLGLIAARIRNVKTPDSTFLSLANVYAKNSDWKLTEIPEAEPTPETPEIKTLDALVLELEKRNDRT